MTAVTLSKAYAETRGINVKDLLEQVRYIDDEVAALRELQASVWADLTNTTSRPTNTSVSTSPDPHRLDVAALLAADVGAKLYELAEAKRAALSVVNRLGDTRHRSVLLAYYVNCRAGDGRRKTWENVADEMGYSLRQAQRIRDDALALLVLSGPNRTRNREAETIPEDERLEKGTPKSHRHIKKAHITQRQQTTPNKEQ